MRNGHPAFSRTVDTGHARIEWGDTLNSPALVEADRLMRFNVVVGQSALQPGQVGRCRGPGRPIHPLLARGAT